MKSYGLGDSTDFDHGRINYDPLSDIVNIRELNKINLLSSFEQDNNIHQDLLSLPVGQRNAQWSNYVYLR